MEKIRIGIVGGAGYTGGELLRLLIPHPAANIAFVHSKSQAGKLLAEVHTDLIGDTDLAFTNALHQEIDVLFLCVGHGDAARFLSENPFDQSIKIIDLSQDFRLKSRASYEDSAFIYGLPELNRDRIRVSQYIANPGCFATCIELALLPLAHSGLLYEEIHVNATTGSTGAGQSLSATSHFSWRNNNLSVYKAFDHQHLHEIRETLGQLQSENLGPLHFIPQRGDFTRGIFASIYLKCSLSEEEVYTRYEAYYKDHPFTHVSKGAIDLKQVVNTNKCLLHVRKHGTHLMITSIIDNLLKGASGQAVQNMNLLFGRPEMEGLRLKASYF